MLKAQRFAASMLALGLIVFVSRPAMAELRLSLDQVIGKTKGWTIGYNNSFDGCLAAAKYRDQTTVWFGLGRAIGPYIAFSNPRWNRIEVGKKYVLRLRMGRQGTWRGNFVGIAHGDEMGLITTGVKAQFFGDFARAGGIVVSYNDSSIARLDLLGSRAALQDVIACQRAHPSVAQGPKPPPNTEPAARSKPKGESFGTGFFVSQRGHVLTNHHVINGCTSFRIARGGTVSEKVRVVADDVKNDLALLSSDLQPAAVPALRTGVKVGESIAVYGFPLAGLLASTGNFTTGNVTAVAGLGDDTRMIQISAPVQPGNSGGPLVDHYGNVVGVIVSKLNALKIAQATKDLPQNINFAIKAVIAISFLESNDVSAQTNAAKTALEPPEIAERAKTFTVRVSCK